MPTPSVNAVPARPAPDGLRYQVITGSGEEFARAVSAALDAGYQLQGPPVLGHDAENRTVLAQALTWPS